MVKLILLFVSYLLGSIPFGFLLCYLIKKTDIRDLGSGNIGATNVTRVLGKKWGILVFFLDFLKGVVPPLLILLLVKDPNTIFFVLSIIAAVSGHNWPIFLKFKGGKGVSTSLGGIVGLCIVFPYLILLFVASIAVWLAVFFIFRIVSLASLASVFCFFILSLIISLPYEFKFFSFLLFILVVVRHKKNIKNLLQKKELNF